MSQENSSTPILVTGATGRQGGTGRAVAECLIKSGRRVRALVRSIDDRAERLQKMGAEIVVGDFANYASLLSALEGIKSAYFCHPVGPGIAEAAGMLAAAGGAQKLERVVDLSLGTSRPDSPSPQGRAQWVSEQIFEWAGFAGTHLRIAAFFMDNILLIDGPGIRDRGRIANSFGDLPLPWIAGADVGALAASLILNPALAQGSRTVFAGGVEMLTYEDIAETLSDTLDRSVRYEELSPQSWHSELTAASVARSGEANVRGADHLVAQSVALRAKPVAKLPDHVLEFTGRTPLSFNKFVVAHREQLVPNV